MRTIVIQSHRQPLPYDWMHACIASVKRWAADRDFEYRFVGDELFDALTPRQRRHTRQQPVVASDLGRLYALSDALDEGADRVVWCDADTLIINRAALELPETGCALGREVWIQPAKVQNGMPRVFAKVHNAFMVFCRGDSALPFYRDAASKLLELHEGPYVDQFIGPKLLSALHNLVPFPVMENAGVLSPSVVADLNQGGGRYLEAFCRRLQRVPAALNLCASSVRRGELSEASMATVVSRLEAHGTALFVD